MYPRFKNCNETYRRDADARWLAKLVVLTTLLKQTLVDIGNHSVHSGGLASTATPGHLASLAELVSYT